LKWASAEPQLKNCKAFRSILVTPRTIIDKKAIPHAEHLFFITPFELQSLFDRTRMMLSSVRSVMINENEEEFKEKIMSELVRTDLTPNSILSIFQSKPAQTLKTSSLSFYLFLPHSPLLYILSILLFLLL